MHQQAAIASEQRAILAEHDFEQPAIVCVALVRGVDSEKPEIPR
jgi:hypothetical protein